MTEISVYFHARPGDGRNDAVERILRDHGAYILGAGTMLFGPDAPMRDIQAEVPTQQLVKCCAALRAAGITQIAVEDGASAV